MRMAAQTPQSLISIPYKNAKAPKNSVAMQTSRLGGLSNLIQNAVYDDPFPLPPPRIRFRRYYRKLALLLQDCCGYEQGDGKDGRTAEGNSRIQEPHLNHTRLSFNNDFMRNFKDVDQINHFSYNGDGNSDNATTTRVSPEPP